MGPEAKLYKKLRQKSKGISWIRIENYSSLGTPDLLGYNTSGTFFTVELKVTKGKKIRFSPHQIAFHVKHPHNTFILVKQAKKPSQGSCKLFPGTCILALEKEGFKNKDSICLSLDACGLYLSSLGA